MTKQMKEVKLNIKKGTLAVGKILSAAAGFEVTKEMVTDHKGDIDMKLMAYHLLDSDTDLNQIVKSLEGIAYPKNATSKERIAYMTKVV